MKTRLGFVSNSSSSSFILNLKNDKQFEKKLNDLVKCLAEDRQSWNDEPEDKIEYNKVMNAYKRLKRLPIWSDILSGKLGIQFPSCNYDTYIIAIADKLYCSTSNHVQSFKDDGDWQYVDEGWEDSNPEYDALDSIIRNAKYVSFDHDFKIMTFKEIEDAWGKEVGLVD